MDPETNDKIKPPLKKANNNLESHSLDTVVRHILACIDMSEFEVSLSLSPAEDIQSLNQQFRQKNKPTDILSFPQINWQRPVIVGAPLPQYTGVIHEESKILGDLVICLSVAANNATAIGHSLEREVCFLLVHGILHLCGHDHIERKDEALMIEQQKIIMAILDNEDDDSAVWLGCLNEVLH